MKREKPARVALYVRIPGMKYCMRKRTEAELKEAAQRVFDRREANEIAKRLRFLRRLMSPANDS